MCQQHPQFPTPYRLYMHRTIKPRPHHLRYAARIVAVRLVDLRLQHRLHVPRLNADQRQSCFGESAEQPLRQRSSFQPNSLEVVGEVLQHRQQRLRFARHLYFPNDLACVIHNADARLLDRNVQSSKIVHAALLLLMLEAVFTDLVFTISLKRSTQNLQLSTSCRPITPSFGSEADLTFEAEADPETTTICNCTDCQTMSGAPLRAVIITRPGTFVLLSGKPTEYRKTADSGNVRLQGFCPRCGTALYATSVGDE